MVRAQRSSPSQPVPARGLSTFYASFFPFLPPHRPLPSRLMPSPFWNLKTPPFPRRNAPSGSAVQAGFGGCHHIGISFKMACKIWSVWLGLWGGISQKSWGPNRHFPPPPNPKPPPPPPKRGILWAWVFPAERPHFFQAPRKLAQPCPAPELRAKKFTDTWIFLRIGRTASPKISK